MPAPSHVVSAVVAALLPLNLVETAVTRSVPRFRN